MAGLLSGLGAKFGLGDLENAELYAAPEEPEKKPVVEPVKPSAPVYQEADFLYDKNYDCPVCGRKIKARTVRTGKVKLKTTDKDLRPVYEQLDILKYDVILCENCGHAALSRFFKPLMEKQVKEIQSRISVNYRPAHADEEEEALPQNTYDYDTAIERYKMALANAIVKPAPNSEKAYTCLKAAWVIRGKAEHLDPASPDYEKQKADCLKDEEEFLKNAMEGFITARATEPFPLCGMDESTVDFLIAVNALRFGQLENASKLVARLLTSHVASERLKERARELKEEIIQIVKGKQ